jgi:WD40 repeat protein
VRCVSVSPDGGHVVTSSADGAVRVWDLHASDDPADGGALVTAVAVSPDGQRIVAGHHSGEVVQYSDGQARLLGDHGTPVRAVAAGERHVLASGDDGQVRQWVPEQATLGEHGGRVRSMIIREAAGLVVCGGSGGRVSVWPLAGGPPRIIHVGSEVMAVAAAPDGTIVSGHGTGNVRVVAPNGQIRTLRSGGAQVWAVALDADGRYAASGDRDGRVLLWRLPDGECSRLGEHRGAVTGVAFGVDDRVVISAGEDGVRGWDVVTRAELAHVSTEPITALGVGGGIVATVSATLGVTRWLVDSTRPTA